MNNKRECAALAWPAAVRAACGLPMWLWLSMLVALAQSQEPLPNSSVNLSQRLAAPDRGSFYPTTPPNAPTVPVAVGSEFLKLKPQFLSAVELSSALELAVGNQGSLAVLDSQGLVLVAGPPEVLRRAVYMMEQVDTPRLQVRLAVYLFDVELGELKQLGLAATNQIAAQPDGVLKETSQFHVLSNHLDLTQTLKLLSESSGAKLLADPQLTVIDGQTSSFSIVTRLPVEHGASTERSGPSGSLGYEEVGVKLAITPRVANLSMVELHIVPQYSSVAGFNNQGNPVIESRSAETTVRVAHRQSLVLGGLRKRNSLESVQPAGGLVNRKVVEPWFRSANAESAESELICIIRPEILDGTTAATQGNSLQAMHNSSAMQGLAATPGLITSVPLSTDNAAAVQSGAYQEPYANPPVEQVKPSAYRPSVYAKASTAQHAPRRNINTSRNSVTQPLPLPSRQVK